MEYKQQLPSKPSSVAPRLIIHGGAGNILPSNLSPERYTQFHDSLLSILAIAHHFLTSSSSSSALDTVTLAVTHLENNPLFNSGHGAVFTREGINELEASIMVSRGLKKRGVGVMGLRHVKNPIKLAREMLLRGEEDLEFPNGKGPGAQGHSQLHVFTAEKLAEEWGLEMVEEEYFFTQNRWDEHKRGLEKEEAGLGTASWDRDEFISQGTCGAVALDAAGVIATATSTGGMTNKLTGRIGDTPTLGAGFWAEEWESKHRYHSHEAELRSPGPGLVLSEALKGLMADCLPSLTTYSPIPASPRAHMRVFRSTGMSGTGNGDSFLRTNAARTASAIARYQPETTLQAAITAISGPGGELQTSAGDRWGRTGEGEGGIIAIELFVVTSSDGHLASERSHIVDEFNCGGMFRASVDEHGKAVMRVWKEGQHKNMESYEGEGRPYEVRDWLPEKI